MRCFRGLFLLAVAVLLAASPVTLSAEEGATAPALATVHYDQVEPSRVADYEANARSWVEAFTKAGMGKDHTWHAYFANDFAYAYVSFMPNYAYLDGWEARREEMKEKMGEETVKELFSEVGINSHYDEILRLTPDLSYEPEEEAYDEAGFARVGTHYVKPGMNEQFKELVARVKGAFEKVGAKSDFYTHEIEFGQGSWAVVSWAEDAASFYSQPTTNAILNQALGAEETQKLYADWGNCITRYETKDWVYRPDLSFTPGMGGEKEMETSTEGEQMGAEGSR